MRTVRAISYRVRFCSDPECGLHLTAKLPDGSHVDVILSAQQTLELIDECREGLDNENRRRTS